MSSLRSCLPKRFESNHLQLIHACYPKSKSASEPDSNALGKLTFYTKSRPIKLTKVGHALSRRCSSESANGLCITLSIVKKLLDECRRDVNVFSDEAMEIIGAALARRNESLELSERAAGAFYALATFSVPSAINEELYMPLLRQFCELARDEKQMQLRVIGLHALDGVVSSDLFYALDFRRQADLILTTLMHNVMASKTLPSDLPASDSKETVESPANGSTSAHVPSEYTASPRPALHDRRAKSIRTAKGLDGTEKPPTSSDTAHQALKTLQAFFRFAQPTQIEVALFCIVDCFDKAPSRTWEAEEWCTGLVKRLVSWTQAQYRFAIVQFWLEQLEALSTDGPHSTQAKTRTVLAILTSVLSHPTTSIVNLAIGDVLSSLSSLIIRHPEQLERRKPLISLASHIYYPEQLGDLIGDLLVDALEVQEQLEESEHKSSAISALFECIEEMWHAAAKKELQPSESWFASLGILDSSDPRTRTKYLNAIATILPTASSSASAKQTQGLPSITLGTGLSLSASESSRFAKELQIRLFTLLQKEITQDESQAIARVLSKAYGGRDARIVLEGVPILLSWGSGENVKALQAAALTQACETWNVSPKGNLLEDLSTSSSLQEAAGLSADELRARISSPYSHSPLSGSSFANRAISLRNGRPHSIRALQDQERGLPVRSRAGSVIGNTSLADLKQSLNPESADMSAASSIRSVGSSIPAHHQHQNGSVADSPAKSLNGKRRLDVILGSLDEGKLPPQRLSVLSPPYQLS